MAGEIQFDAPTGINCYVLIRTAGGPTGAFIYSPVDSDFLMYQSGNYLDYSSIAATEQGTSGYYTADMPTTFGIVIGGVYEIVAKRRVSGTPAETDPTIAVGELQWDGTSAVLPLSGVITGVWTNATRTITGGTITTVSDKTGYFLATDGLSALAVSAAAGSKLADIFLRRQMANVFASSFGDALSKSSVYGQVQQGQKSSVAATTMTVLNTDGSTLGTFTLTVSASADPVTGIA
jgi:hypothetical protein